MAMFEDLLRLYEKAQVNSGEPRSIFGETFLFNEGWLLAGVLSLWQWGEKPSDLPFLPFQEGSLVRAPVQLYTPFKKVKSEDALGDEHPSGRRGRPLSERRVEVGHRFPQRPDLLLGV